MANDLGYAALANRAYKDPTTVGWAQQLQDNITALVALLSDYRKGCRISYVDANTISIDTGAMVVAGKLRRNTATATVTWSDTGGNTIAETSSTSYCIWAVASGASSTMTFAINQTAASMTGNANSRFIGQWYNGTGNAIEQLWDTEYGKVFGLWQIRTDSTVYQADTDGMVVAYQEGGNTITGYTDSADASTVRQKCASFGTSLVFPVRKGDYWKVVGVADTIWWVPIGGSKM